MKKKEKERKKKKKEKEKERKRKIDKRERKRKKERRAVPSLNLTKKRIKVSYPSEQNREICVESRSSSWTSLERFNQVHRYLTKDEFRQQHR